MTSWWHSSCVICHKPTAAQAVICSICQAALEPIRADKACIKCKAPLQAAQHCAQCLQTPWYFEQFYCPYYYNAMAKYLLHHLKFYRQLFFLPSLSHLMIQNLAHYFQEDRPKAIIPVPLHRLRLVKRGFNQAHELAKRLGQAYGIPLQNHWVSKVKSTPAQANLPALARQTNLNKSFRVSLKFSCDHILLVDDVFTTGATLNALAYEFHKAGVRRIDVMTLFRAYF